MGELSHGAVLAPPQFVEKVVQLSSGGNGTKAFKHNQLLRLVSEALSLAPNRDPFLYSIACFKSLGEGAFTPAQQNSIGHLIAVAVDQCERAPAYASKDRAPSCRKAAVLVSLTLQGHLELESRLMVKVATLFGVKSPDLPASARLHAPQFAQRLIDERNYAAGMALTQQLELGPKVAESLLLQMIEDGAASAALGWAKQMGKEVGARLATRLGELGNHKVAWQLIQGLGLQDSFPGAYIRYRKTSITKCAKKGIWGVAKSLAEEDPILQEHLVETAIIEEEFRLAIECAERFGLDHLLTDSVLAASGLPSETDCLKLPIPPDRIVFVDTLEGLSDAQKEICASDIVGLDSEWKADQVRGAPLNPVALLQLATRGRAWLVDLIALGKSAPGELSAFLSSIFSNPGTLKLGFAVNGDLDRISRTHPELRHAVSTCAPLLDLAALAKARGVRSRSLTGICNACIGKPLSKRVRMSNWEQRPLSEAQLHYAALDALCLVPLFDVLSDPAFVAPDESKVGKLADASEAVNGASFGSGGTALLAGDGAPLRIVREPSGALLSVSEPSNVRTSRSNGQALSSAAGLAVLLPPASAGPGTPPADVSAVAERVQGVPDDVSSSKEGGGSAPLSGARPPWQALVYSYSAKGFLEGPTRRQRRRLEKHGAKLQECPEGLRDEQGLKAGLETGEKDTGLGSEYLQESATTMGLTDVLTGNGAGPGPEVEERAAAENTAAGFDAGPAQVSNGIVGEVAGGSLEQEPRGAESDVEHLGVWAGLGLPERVATALHKGGLVSGQVSVLQPPTGRQQREIEIEREPENGMPLMREAGLDNQQASKQQTAQKSSDSAALEEWRAAKRAENGQSGSVEIGHVASNERPTWQVRCIPVLVSVLEEASPLSGLDSGSSSPRTSDIDPSRSEAPAPLAEVGSGAAPEDAALSLLADLAARQSKKQRLKLVVALIDEGQTPDLAAIAKHLGMPGRAVWVASEEECHRHFGFPSSLLPPLGHLSKAALVIDSSLRAKLITANARLVTASGERGVDLAWEIPPLVQRTRAVTRDFALAPKEEAQGVGVLIGDKAETRSVNSSNSGLSGVTAPLEEGLGELAQEEMQFGALQSSAVKRDGREKSDRVSTRSVDEQPTAVHEFSNSTTRPGSARVPATSGEGTQAANFAGRPEPAVIPDPGSPAEKVNRRRMKMQRALRRKSPLAGTGKVVGLRKRKELEAVTKALGLPSRGTRGVSTGLGAGLRGLAQNPAAGEDGLHIDLRRCFAPAWVGVPEGQRPFWEGLFLLCLAWSKRRTQSKHTLSECRETASRTSPSTAQSSKPCGSRPSSCLEQAALSVGLLLAFLSRLLVELRVGSAGLTSVILAHGEKLPWQRRGMCRRLSSVVPAGERRLRGSAFQSPIAQLAIPPTLATPFPRSCGYKQQTLLLDVQKLLLWRLVRFAKGQGRAGLSGVRQADVGRPLAVCRAC